MILSDSDIKEEIEKNNMIFPYELENIQPSSYDITLSKKIRVNTNSKFQLLTNFEAFTLEPFKMILASSKEKFNLPDYIAGLLLPKSSWTRQRCYSSIGWVDPGFSGNLTFQICNFSESDVILYPGKKIAQVVFFLTSSRVKKPYAGKYQNSDTDVPVEVLNDR